MIWARMRTRDTTKHSFVSDSRLESIVAERAVSKSRVPAGAIPRGVNFALGGLAGFVDVPSVPYTAFTLATSELGTDWFTFSFKG